ncbi:MAG: 4Fe-4S binding protein [Candidatus Eisenbacteria bacterium]|nr:4Fe-4S binding protein [Candidatus Eisenbacteria bacterium]
MTQRIGAQPFLRIDREKCLSCAACVAVCPLEALLLAGLDLVFAEETCTGCAECFRVCPTAALLPESGRFYREVA